MLISVSLHYEVDFGYVSCLIQAQLFCMCIISVVNLHDLCLLESFIIVAARSYFINSANSHFYLNKAGIWFIRKWDTKV